MINAQETRKFTVQGASAHAKFSDHAGPGGALALARSSVLPSPTRRASAPGMRSFSRLNSLAWALPYQHFTTALVGGRA
jgi:hypothetical protein